MPTNSRSNPTATQAAAQATKPTFFVINDVLFYQAKAGDELQFDLDFPGDVYDKMFESDLTSREQFLTLVEGVGGKKLLDRVKKMGALEQSRLVTGYFAAFEKATEVELGESGSSSDS